MEQKGRVIQKLNVKSAEIDGCGVLVGMVQKMDLCCVVNARKKKPNPPETNARKKNIKTKEKKKGRRREQQMIMDTNMENIYNKLQQARKIIRESNEKKAGKNEFSKYDYFTPEQVEGLVSKACEETKTICLTSLKKDEFGYFQHLTLVNLENGDKLDFELRTEKPSIKATNDTQQMGGMDTYSERYIKMKVFQIKDNNLDFDSQDNTKGESKKVEKVVDEDDF